MRAAAIVAATACLGCNAFVAADAEVADTGTGTDTGTSTDTGADTGADTGTDTGTGTDTDLDTDSQEGEGGEGVPAWAEAKPWGAVAHCPGLDLRVEAVADGVVRLRYPALGAPERQSWAVVAPPDLSAVEVGGEDGALVVRAGAIGARVDAACRVRVTDDSGATLLEDAEGGGWSAGEVPGTSRVDRRAEPGERFYGLGEKTGGLDRRGRRLVMRNTDAFDPGLGGWKPDADPLYASIPFLVGVRGGRACGVLTDVTWRTVFDLAATDPAAWSVEADGGGIDQYVVAGPRIPDVLDRYTRLTGRPAMPPRWALGYHQSRWGYSPASRVEEIARGFRDRAIPADGIWLDIQHMDGFRVWTFDPVAFADPAGLISRLAAAGFKTTLIADPGVKVDPAWEVYSDGLAGGHFLAGTGGGPWIGMVWPGPSAFPDFTRAATRAWWGKLAGRAVVAGARGVWLDMNEPTAFDGPGGSVPDAIATGGDGVPGTMAEAHNAYALLEAGATFDGLLAAAPDRRPFLLTRAGYAGIQRHAAMWTGDGPSTWDTLRGTLPMLLGMGLSGLANCGSDVGGYSGRASPEMFARWMALGSISPFFRGHTATDGNDQEPWAFGPEVEAISRAVIQDRYRLLPYLYSLFREAATRGAPVLRPLAWEFPDDPAAGALGDQAMLGPWLMVAPVVEQGAATRTVHLPPGRWFEWRSGAARDGPADFVQGLRLAALPAWVREGAIVPSGPLAQWSDAAPVSPLYLDAWPGPAETSFAVYEDAGDGFGPSSTVTYRTVRTADGATLSAGGREGTFEPPERPLVVRLHRVDSLPASVTLDGSALSRIADVEAVGVGATGWAWDARDLSLVIAFRDRPAFTLALKYDTALSDLAPPVAVRFRVRVPAGTAHDRKVHVATSASGWSHQALEWVPGVPDVAEGETLLPRGEWFDYKITRGDWETVEKWPGCQEATNRYGFASAWPVRDDTVSGWADSCR
ncbi:MAG: alpha-glucosidase [Deltaproteobacteria bacterium]|nr:alpha-glucosidase [Deltaproteobacteria bacterium]